jgi:MFS family permease
MKPPTVGKKAEIKDREASQMTTTEALIQDAVPSVAEQQLMRRIIIRLMPIVTIIYLIAIIDRSNIGFAKLQMMQDLHMSEAIYGLGASLFFIGYLVFEIPSTLAVHRFGARGWLARIMFSWGIVTILLAFAYSTTSFYILRLLLGIAEAGCYPGLIYFIGLWFPQSYRVAVVGVLTLGSAFGNMLGSLLGGLLLDLNGALGFAGWQWVFLATGVPAVIMSVLILLLLPSTPKEARFLSDPEKSWLTAEVQRGQSAARAHGVFWSVIGDVRVLFFSLIYALILCALYGVIYWIPTVVKGFGVTGTQNGLLSAAPWAIAAVALMIIPRRLKHEPETLTAMGIMSLIGLLAFVASTLVGENWMRFVGMAIGSPCVSLLLPCFWSLPSRRFSGAQAATAIGAISTLGNLGGFIAQNMMPYVAQATGSAVGAMLVPAACITVVGLSAIAMRYSRAARFATS